jgi:hypothetical protein
LCIPAGRVNRSDPLAKNPWYIAIVKTTGGNYNHPKPVPLEMAFKNQRSLYIADEIGFFNFRCDE